MHYAEHKQQQHACICLTKKKRILCLPSASFEKTLACKGWLFSQRQVEIEQLIPCIRDSRKAPVAAILNAGWSSFTGVLPIYRWVTIDPKSRQIRNVENGHRCFHLLYNLLQDYILFRNLSHIGIIHWMDALFTVPSGIPFAATVLQR